MPYRAPVRDLRFILDHVVGFAQVAATPRFAEATPEMATAILTEAGRIATDVLAPLNRAGDRHPARLENGAVVSSPGFAEGYRAMAQGGWTWATDPVFNIGFPGDFGPEVLLAQYALVDRPVLVLTGTEEDAWTGLPEDELAERVVALGAEHQAVPGAGHYVHIEQPEVVIDAVLRFATEVDGTGATAT